MKSVYLKPDNAIEFMDTPFNDDDDIYDLAYDDLKWGILNIRYSLLPDYCCIYDEAFLYNYSEELPKHLNLIASMLFRPFSLWAYFNLEKRWSGFRR